jgi:hypothetical protein
LVNICLAFWGNHDLGNFPPLPGATCEDL